jgi:outer membrane usher protein
MFRWPGKLLNPLLLTGILALLPAHFARASGDANGGAPGSGLAVVNGPTDAISMGVGDDLYLEVILNQQPTGQLAHFGLRNGHLWARLSTLRRLGFKLPPGSPDPMLLSRIPGVIVHYDDARQQVRITAPLSLLNLKTTVLNAASHQVPDAKSSPGLLLNYDLYGTAGQHGSKSLSGFTELRAFSQSGVFSNTELTQVNRRQGQGWKTRSVRLDSSWQTSFPGRMLTLRVGDTLTGALAWSRSTHIAGVQLSRNFSLQPYRITTPVPTFLGQATVPSSVELYLNGIKQYSSKVAPGPFRVSTAPTINGSGDAQVVLTDALGRSTSIDFPFYTAQTLLQQGLSDWSGSIGVVRRSYGLKSFDYGRQPAVNGTWRYGASDTFTAQAHAEATPGVTDAGVGATWLVSPRFGVLNGSFSRSHGQGLQGGQYSLGYQWRSGPFNFSANSTRTSGNFRDVASLYGAPPPSVSERALVGYSTRGIGSFSVSYLHLRYAAGSPVNHAPQSPFIGNIGYAASDSRYASAFWFKSIARSMSLNLSINQNLNDHRDRSLFLGFTMSLDDRTQLSASVQRDGRRNSFTFDANHSVPSDTGYGWRAQARAGAQHGGLAEGTWRGNHGQIRAGVSTWQDNSYAYADGSGALVLMGGHVFASRNISDAFAVVSTDGVANVPVKLENRPIGKTDRAGMLLVTPLNAWQKNQLSIDPMDLPADVRIAHVKTIATPSDRAGTLVRFGITPVRAASIILHDAAGKPLPLGSPVRIVGQKDTGAMVGFDGTVYLDTLDVHNTLEVTTRKGRCQVRFDYHKQGNTIPQIGPLTCRMGVTP